MARGGGNVETPRLRDTANSKGNSDASHRRQPDINPKFFTAKIAAGPRVSPLPGASASGLELSAAPARAENAAINPALIKMAGRLRPARFCPTSGKVKPPILSRQAGK